MTRSIDFSRVALACWLIASSMMLGCKSTGTQEAAPLGPLDPPVWVSQGCSAYWPEGTGNVKCAVGKAERASNLSAARASATGRGHQQLSAAFHAVLPKVVAKFPGAKKLAEGEEEQLTRQVVDFVVDRSLIVDEWVSPDDTLYMLISINLGGFRTSLGSMTNEPRALTDHLSKNADKVFKALAKL